MGSVRTDTWDTGVGEPGTIFRLASGNLVARLTPLGAAIVGLDAPDRDGDVADVVLQLASPDGYRNNGSNFGAVVGRYANRIGGAKFELDGETHSLEANNGPNCLHSGSANLGVREWDAEADTVDGDPAVRFTVVDPDGSGGFPGEVTASATYVLREDGTLSLSYEATTTRPTVVSLTNHAYWNMAGHDAGDGRLQRVMIDAGRVLEVDENVLPTGRLLDVAGTPFDFREGAILRSRWDDLTAAGWGGYDHCFVLDGGGLSEVAAELHDPVSDRLMTVRTTLPGCQLYTAAHLDGSPGNGGYGAFAGVGLECQQFPNSPNVADFPSTVLRPGETFKHVTEHTFGLRG